MQNRERRQLAVIAVMLVGLSLSACGDSPSNATTMPSFTVELPNGWTTQPQEAIDARLDQTSEVVEGQLGPGTSGRYVEKQTYVRRTEEGGATITVLVGLTPDGTTLEQELDAGRQALLAEGAYFGFETDSVSFDGEPTHEWRYTLPTPSIGEDVQVIQRFSIHDSKLYVVSYSAIGSDTGKVQPEYERIMRSWRWTQT